MAQRDRSHDPDDIEALLAEVDRTLQGKPAAGGRPAGRARQAPASERNVGGGRLSRATRNGLTAGLVAAAVIAVAFAFLPFVAAWSGAIGAFLGAFGAGFALGLGKR